MHQERRPEARRGLFEPAIVGLMAGLTLGALLWWAVGASVPKEAAAPSVSQEVAVAPPATEHAAAAIAQSEADATSMQVEVPAPPGAVATEPARVVVAAPPSPPPATAPAPPPVPAAQAIAGTAGPWVQVAALGSQAEAEAVWRALAAEHTTLLGPFEPRVTRFARDGKEFFRLRVGPFPSRSEADALCGALRRAGGACFVAASGG